MVNEKAVRLVHTLTVAPEGGGHRFALFPGIYENKAFFALGMLIDIAEGRVGVFRGFGGLFLRHREKILNVLSFGGLEILDIEMLHAQPPAAAFGFDFGNDRISARSQGKETACSLRVAHSGRKPDAPGIDTGHPGKPLDEAQCLAATVSPQQGMDFVDDHEAQVMEQPGNGGMLVQKQGFQRFRGDLQNARRVLHQLGLMALGHIAVPVPDRDVSFPAKVVKAGKLVIDQCFQRAHIDTAHGGGWIFRKQGQNGKEGRFRFAGGSGGREQHIFVGIENGFARRHLDSTEVFPAVGIDKFLHKGCVAIKHAHLASSL